MMDYYRIYAKDRKHIPEWMKANHDWQDAVQVDELQKLQLEVEMCCRTCEEKVIEEILEVDGVFDVRAERLASKVVVVVKPGGRLDEHEVLRKARKVSRKARFVELDAKEKRVPQTCYLTEDDGDMKMWGIGAGWEAPVAPGMQNRWRPPVKPERPYLTNNLVSTPKGGRNHLLQRCTIL